MKKQLSKLLGAGALSFAAMSASMSVSAVELASTQFSCPPDVGLTDCYAGSVLGKGSDTSFLDLEIGSFTVADAMADVLGFFDTKWLKLTSLTLSSGESSFTVDGKHGDVAFEDLAAGTYTVSISGMLKHPDRFPFLFGHDEFRVRVGIYGGGLGVVPQIPEPETYALMLAGLLTMFGCRAGARRAEIVHRARAEEGAMPH